MNAFEKPIFGPSTPPLRPIERIGIWAIWIIIASIPICWFAISYLNSNEHGRANFFSKNFGSHGECSTRSPSVECQVKGFVGRTAPQTLPGAQLRISADQQRDFACGSQPFPCGATLEQLRATTELNPTAQPGAQPIKATLSSCMSESALRAELTALSETGRRAIIETQTPAGGCAASASTELRDGKGQATAIIPNSAGVSATLLDIPECMPEPEREALMASIAKAGTLHVITRSLCSAR